MNIVFAYHNGDVELAIESAKSIRAIGANIRHKATICCPAETKEADQISRILKDCFVDVGRIVAQDGFNGWPLGPNQMFVDAAVECYPKGEPWYFWEPDCVPVKAGWCDILQDEYAKNPSILGCMYNEGTTTGGKKVHKLIVGSAIYPPNFFDYCPLARNLNSYNLSYRSAGVEPEPWDVYCRWEFLKIARDTPLIRAYWKSVNYQRKDGKIVFFADSPDAQEIQNVTCPDRVVSMDAVVIHGCKDGSLHKMVQDGFLAPSISTGLEQGVNNELQSVTVCDKASDVVRKPPKKSKKKRVISEAERERRSNHMKVVAAKRWGKQNVQSKTS